MAFQDFAFAYFVLNIMMEVPLSSRHYCVWLFMWPFISTDMVTTKFRSKLPIVKQKSPSTLQSAYESAFKLLSTDPGHIGATLLPKSHMHSNAVLGHSLTLSRALSQCRCTTVNFSLNGQLYKTDTWCWSRPRRFSVIFL